MSETRYAGLAVSEGVAVAFVLDAYEARLRSLDDEYLRERGSDIGEVKWRLLDMLRDTSPGLQCADSENCQKGRRRIIIRSKLFPKCFRAEAPRCECRRSSPLALS